MTLASPVEVRSSLGNLGVGGLTQTWQGSWGPRKAFSQKPMSQASNHWQKSKKLSWGKHTESATGVSKLADKCLIDSVMHQALRRPRWVRPGPWLEESRTDFRRVGQEDQGWGASLKSFVYYPVPPVTSMHLFFTWTPHPRHHALWCSCFVLREILVNIS